MYKTLTVLHKRAVAIRSDFGSPVDVGQSVQWAAQVVKAAGVAIRQDTGDDLGWQVWRNGQVAASVNWRLDELKRKITG